MDIRICIDVDDLGMGNLALYTQRDIRTRTAGRRGREGFAEDAKKGQ